GRLAGDVDAKLGHRAGSQGPDEGGFAPRAERFVAIPREVAQQPLGHLRPRRVMGAEEEHALLLPRARSAHRRTVLACRVRPPSRLSARSLPAGTRRASWGRRPRSYSSPPSGPPIRGPTT